MTYPPQYPSSSNSLNLSLSLFLYFFCPPPHLSSLSPLFFPFFPCFLFVFFLFFFSFFPDPLLLFFSPFPPALFLTLSTFLFLVSARPYESCKIFKGRPRRNAFSTLIHRPYKSFPPDRFCQVEIQKPTGLSTKPSTALSCAEDQILENKNLRNMILYICTGQ